MSDIDQFVGWVFSSKEVSLDRLTGNIRDAFYRKYEPSEAPAVKAEASLWVHEIYADHVIAARGGEFFKIGYRMVDGAAVFDDAMIPVEQIWREKVA